MLPESIFRRPLAVDRCSPLAGPVRRLSWEEETELIRRVQLQSDRRAAEAITRAHRPFVVKFALRYRRYGMPVDDLIAEAHVELVHALGKFDPQRGVRFVTYAKHWMRAFVIKYVLANWNIVSGGSVVMRPCWFFLLRRERARHAGVLGEAGDPDGELAERLGLSRDKVRQMLERLDVNDVSLDTELIPNSGVRMVDQLPSTDNQEQSLLDLEFHANLTLAIERALAALDPRERYIVERRMMVETGDALSLADIGRAFGISRERARQLEVRAARKLRETVMASGETLFQGWFPARRPLTARPRKTSGFRRVRSKFLRAGLTPRNDVPVLAAAAE